jgi:nucleotide-binding universal stress UspA family protein
MKVLLAVDDLTFGMAIVEFVREHHWPEGTVFKVLNCMEDIPVVANLAGVPVLLPEEVFDESEDYAKRIVHEVASRIRAMHPDLEVETAVVRGNASYEILQMAKEWPSDLILMGSHGRKGLTRFLMGSVSRDVVSNGPCSVVVIRLPAQQSAA